MQRLLLLIIPLLLLSCSRKPPTFAMVHEIDLSAEYTLFTPDLDTKRYAPTHKYLEIEIQGQLYPFILDTGDRYGTLKISSETIKKMDVTPLDEKRRSKNIYGKNSETLYLVPGVKIGNMQIDNLICEVSEDSWFWPWNTVHEDVGMIGWGLLREFNFYLDYSKGELVFYNRETIPGDILKWEAVAYKENRNMISLKGSFSGSNRRESLLIDTGAGSYHYGSETDPFLDVLFSGSFKRNGNPQGSEIEILIRDFITADTTLEELRFSNMSVPWFLSYKYDGFLGWGFFWNHIVFFDNKNQRIYIKKDDK